MAPYILDNLDQVRHTHVRCKIAEHVPGSTITKIERKSCLVSSERADSVIAKLYNMSRSQGVELFRAKKVFINGRLNENNSGETEYLSEAMASLFIREQRMRRKKESFL